VTAAELHVLTGQRAGVVLALTGAECTLGRHPDAALRFHSGADGAVSARHAHLVRDAGGWALRDLGSTNGTYVNGRRVAAPTPLKDGDRITLGRGGPLVEFRLAGSPGALTPSALPPAAPGPVRPLLAAAVAAVVLASALWTAPLARHFSTPAPSASRRIGDGSDAVRTPFPPLSHRSPIPPAGRLDRPSPRRMTDVPSPRLPARGAAPLPDPRSGAASAGVDARPSDAPATTPDSLAAVASVDVGRRNRMAVARIWVEGQDGEVATGTAFAVRGDATLVTNRHVVAGAGGRGTPRRIAVQFAASSQVWPARLVATSDEADLAVVKVDSIVGTVPTVRGFNLRPDTVAAGAPVVVAGFPGGGEAVRGSVARPVLAPATLAAVRKARVEMFARSAAGASGSPVFDANGEVVAVLYGGAPRAARPLLFGVPAAAVARLLDGIP
jgi:S1-C subfamily serine protease